MRKIFSLLLFSFFLHGIVAAQQTDATTAQSKATEEIRSTLTSKLQLSTRTVEKIISIESEFFAKLAAVQTTAGLSVQEVEMKNNEAHVTRRAKLKEVPLAERQMEEVMDLVESIRRKHKL